MKSIFSKNLRKKREQLGWNQTIAAKRLELGETEERQKRNYRNLEYSKNEPSLTILQKVVEIFSIDDLYLFITKELK